MSSVIELTILRGAVEKFMDNMLSVNFISKSRRMFDAMKPAIKNSDDAIFGYIYGAVIGKFDGIYAILNRQATNEEVDEILKVIQKRTMEIKSRIYETKT